MIKNIDSTLNNLRNKIKDKLELEIFKATQTMLNELRAATPIKTGKARSGWNLVRLNKDEAVISNNVVYIERLNNGSSKQASAHFVERTALKYGKPLGSIITVRRP
jgi:hypothetical protein